MTTFSEETQSQANVFNQIGEDYETVFGANPTEVEAVAWLIEKLTPGGNVLDIGCGTGLPTTKMLTEAGFEVLGIDISSNMLAVARRQVPQATFALMDIATADLGDQRFAAITAFFCLLMLPKASIEASLNKIVNHLQPEGYFIVSMTEGDFDYIPIDFMGQPVRVSAYLRGPFKAILEATGLVILDMKAVPFMPQGSAHTETQLFYFCQRK